MFKKNDGITLVSLTVTIIILIILLSVTIRGASYMLTDSKLKSCITNMILVQTKVKSIYEKYEFSGDIDVLIGTKLEDGRHPSYADLNSYDSTLLSNSEANPYWYQWSRATLEENNIDPKILPSVADSFYVNYLTSEIVYSKGFKDSKGNKHFSLSDMLSLQ